MFGLINPQDNLSRRFNYTLLFMPNYIYEHKLKEGALLLPDFVSIHGLL